MKSKQLWFTSRGRERENGLFGLLFRMTVLYNHGRLTHPHGMVVVYGVVCSRVRNTVVRESRAKG